MTIGRRAVLLFVLAAAKLVAVASGTVLEMGVGSARNMPHCGRDTVHGTASRPRSNSGKSAGTAWAQPFPLHYLACSAEHLPVADHSIDTALFTWKLCSIRDVRAALREMRRVMNPGGCFIFIEHGRTPDARVSAWQDRLTPVWAKISPPAAI